MSEEEKYKEYIEQGKSFYNEIKQKIDNNDFEGSIQVLGKISEFIMGKVVKAASVGTSLSVDDYKGEIIRLNSEIEKYGKLREKETDAAKQDYYEHMINTFVISLKNTYETLLLKIGNIEHVNNLKRLGSIIGGALDIIVVFVQLI